MNIAVMSPHTQKNGNTTVAALIASELATRNRKVCLTHTTSKSNALFRYFGVNGAEDKTCNPIQIYNLIREGGIRKNDIGDYCRGVSENLEIFTMNSGDITNEQLVDVSNFICTSFPHDHVVFDFDNNDLESPVNSAIIQNCDCVVYVLTQSITELDEFNKNKDEYLSWLEELPVIVVVNRFCDIVSNLKKVALSIGVKKPKKWYKIGFNPWVTFGTSNGKFDFLFENVQQRDHHVVDVDSDVKALVNGILSIKHAKHNSKYDNPYEMPVKFQEVKEKKKVSIVAAQ